jgi:hypothetical protein
MQRLIDANSIKIPSTSVDAFENCRNCNLLDEFQVREIIDSEPTIDAIPIEWLIRMRNKHNNDGFAWIYEAVMDDWREEHAETD